MSCANSIYLDPVTYILILTQLNKYFKCPLNYDTLITQIEIHYLLVLQCGISTAYTVVSSLSLWMRLLVSLQMLYLVLSCTGSCTVTSLLEHQRGCLSRDVTACECRDSPVSSAADSRGWGGDELKTRWVDNCLSVSHCYFFIFFIFLWLYTFYFPTKKCSWGGFKPGDGSLTLAWGCVAECNRGGLIQLVSRKMMFMLHWNATHQALERHKRDPFC